MPDTAPGPDRSVPVVLVVGAVLAVVEAAALASLGVLEIASLRLARLTMGATTAVFFIAAAVGLAWCAWSLWRVQRWARGPVVMAQLIQLGLAWNLRAGETRPVALVLALVAFVVLGCLLHPASTQVLEEDARSGA